MNTEKITSYINEELSIRHLTIKDLSSEIDENYNVVYRFLTNQVEYPKVDAVFKLIKFFGVPDEIASEALNLSLNSDKPLDASFVNDAQNRSLHSLVTHKIALSKLTYKELAYRMGVAQSYLSKAMKTIEDSNLLIISKICAELDISYFELIWSYGLIDFVKYENVSSNGADSPDYNTDISIKRFLKLLHDDTIEQADESDGFLEVGYEEWRKTYILMSSYCFYELGVLLREYIDFSDKSKGRGVVKILPSGGLRLRELLTTDSHGVIILSAGEYANKIKREELHVRFRLLYFLLRNIESKEKNRQSNESKKDT